MDAPLKSTSSDTQLVYSLAASARFGRDPSGICFAGCTAGLLRSSDGERWQNVFAALPVSGPTTVTAVAVSPSFEQDNRVFAGVNGGILVSNDGGIHWISVQFPPPLPLITCLAISPNFQQDGTLFAGTMEDGVFISSDEGTHWVPWNFGLLDLNILCLAISPDFAHDETLFVGTESGIFRSTNGGRAWREVFFPAGYIPVWSLALSPNFSRDRVIFAGSESDGLFRSQDGGSTWVPLNIGRDPEIVSHILPGTGYPQNPELLALCGSTLLFSGDNGLSWSERPVAGTEPGEICAVIAPQGVGKDARLVVGLVGGKVTWA